MADRRRAGILAVLLLLAGGLALALLPGPAAARVFGVGLLWWCCAVVAPALALLATIVAQPMTPTSIAAAVSPVLVATLLARVFTGVPEAPLLVLAAAVAPLLGVLVGPPAVRRDHVTAGVALASAGLLVWAGCLLAGDLALAFEHPRWHGVGIAGAVGLTACLRAAGYLRASVLAGAVVVLAVPVVVLSARGLAPWQAWASLASRPALLFAERGPAASGGAVLRVGAVVDLDEAHRVTAMSRAVYRVVERDGEAPSVREWRLDPGDALILRPGDRLELAAGAHVRFEAGKRIPGAAVSGVAWADPVARDHDVVLNVAALALTLAAGAAALVAGKQAGGKVVTSRLAMWLGLSLPPALALLAVCWGVYAADATPELGLGAPPIAALAAVPGLLPFPTAGLVAALAALAALFAASVSALGERIVNFAGPGPKATRGMRVSWAAMIVVAAGLALPRFDAWQALTWGWGLAAAVVLAPALAGANARASRAGAITGALVFAGLAVGGRVLVPWAPVVADYPALAAMPAAWAVAVALGGRLPARRAVRVSR
jgi:hypothetical protein